MSRSTFYYTDYTEIDGESAGHRRRIVWRPADNHTRDIGVQPAWGSGGSGSTGTWKELPIGCFKEIKGKEFGYDTHPIGWWAPPSMSLVYDLAMLVGDPDWEALANYLVNSTALNLGTLWRDPDYSTSSRTIHCYNIVTVLTDQGNASWMVDQFVVDFMGTQAEKLEDTLDVNGAGEILLTIEALDLLRMAMQTVIPEDVTTYALAANAPVAVRYLIYDTYWENSGFQYFRVLGTDTRFGVRKLISFYALSSLWESIEIMIERVLTIWLGAPADIEFLGIALDHPGPFTALELGAQSGTSTGNRVELSGASLNYAALPAVIALDNDPDVMTGGYFHPDEADGIYRYETIWDMMKVCVQAGVCRTTLFNETPQAQSGSVTIQFVPVDWINMNEIISDMFRDRPKPVLRQDIVAGAEADIVGAVSGDVQSASYQQWGIDEDTKRTVPTVFNCVPHIGDLRDVWIYGTPSVVGTFNGETTTGPFAVMGSPTIPPNMLVYMYQPSWATHEVPIRFHHHVGIRYDDDVGVRYETLDAPSVPYPTPYAGGTLSVSNDVIRSFVWVPWRSIAIEIQQGGGIVQAAVIRTGRLFSSVRQYGLTVSVPYHYAMLAQLGSMSDISMLDTLPPQPRRPVASSTGATPIVVEVTAHGYYTGNRITITAHTQTAANGTWSVTVIDVDHFSLDTSAGVGAGTAGGYAQRQYTFLDDYSDNLPPILTQVERAGAGLSKCTFISLGGT